ncbi:hypothetical protein G7Y89_g682 [Cudoniella acicularis]|uniref:Uncharacterized protein n=1 Tax=Cudoniella acicularis TaxID=354080 RepID=A0A8H4RXJ4_9HELO|nr:hypothetical protein G7Y89_g682 [Cudoniella acicularis]
MKITSLILLGAFIASAAAAAACPGQSDTMDSLANKLASRDSSLDPYEMIGDLATTSAKTPTGQAVQDILLGNANPYSDNGYNNIL